MREIVKTDRSIVLLGNFNPAIFHPVWFSKQGLIRDEEATRASIGLIHKDVADFSSEWFRLLVTSDRFQLSTLQGGHDEELRDLAIGTFEVLAHSPIHAIGINGTVHFAVETVEEWHRIGHNLVPKEVVWNEILTTPGMNGVAVQGVRTDGYKGRIIVRVGPSVVAPKERGVWVESCSVLCSAAGAVPLLEAQYWKI